MSTTSQSVELDPSSGIFRSLRNKNYQLYYLGQLVSLNGTWMQSTAQAWLVYRLTQSSFMLGLVAFCHLFPVLLLSLVGGVVSDRLKRRYILIVTQSLAMLQALMLAALALSGIIQPSHIIALAVLLGIVNAFEIPARHAFVAEIVPREHLLNAVALNASVFNIARFMGPMLAGFLIAIYGEGLVFSINAVSFTVILICLVLIRPLTLQTPPQANSIREHIKEGLSFAWHNIEIRHSLVMIGLISMLGSAITVLMPVFAIEVFHGGSRTLGFLLSAMGIGALIGALRFAGRRTTLGLERLIGWAALGTGVCAFVFAASDSVWLGVPMVALAALSYTIAVGSGNTLLQLTVDDKLRGRLMSIFSMIFMGLMPFGNLLGGALAELIGAAPTVYLAASGFAFSALLYLYLTPNTSR